MAVRPSVVFNFAFERNSWSERYWRATEGLSPFQLQEDAAELLLLRSRMLAKGVQITNAFVSFDDQFRDVYPVNLPSPDTEGNWPGGVAAVPDQPNACLILRGFAVGGRAGKMIYLAGVPDISITLPPGRPPKLTPSLFEKAFNQFRTRLIETWGWKAVSYDPGTSPIADITGFVAATAVTATITLSTVTGFTKGKYLKITGAQQTPSKPTINRRLLIKADPVGLAIDVQTKVDLSGVSYLGGGKAQVQNMVILPFSWLIPNKIGTRKRGVGASPPRGRRRAQTSQ